MTRYAYDPTASARPAYLEYPDTQRAVFEYFPVVPTVGGTGNGDLRLKTIRNLGAGANGSGAVLSEFRLEYDVAGQIVKWSQFQDGLIPASRRYDLSYDAAGQLVNATLRNAATNALLKTEAYTYDLAGNRIGVATDGVLSPPLPTASTSSPKSAAPDR